MERLHSHTNPHFSMLSGACRTYKPYHFVQTIYRIYRKNVANNIEVTNQQAF